MTLFKNRVVFIESEYKRLGYRLGWRFLMAPAATLRPGTQTLVLTLNPAGDWEPPDHPRAHCPNGSAYRLEAWPKGGPNSFRQPPGGARLQVQVQKLFRWLDEEIDEAPTGCFVPFRSPSWEELPRQDEALSSAKALWAPVLSALRPRLILCIGTNIAFSNVCHLIGASEGQSFPTGWGTCTAKTASTDYTKVIGLPHLSRFPIFGRRASEVALAKLRNFI